MQVKKTIANGTTFNLTLTADQQLLNNVKQQVLRHLAQQHVNLPGFRKGKAPVSLVEKQVDPSLLQSEFLDEAVNQLYRQALRAERLRPVAEPQVSLKKFVPFTELVVDIEIEAIGEIKLPDYKTIKVKRPEVKVQAADVTEVLKSLQQRLSDRQAVDRPAKKGDEVVIDFEGSDKSGKPVSGADGKDYPLVLGSDTFIPGFEPQIIGMKQDGTKQFDIIFPKDYQVNGLRGQKVTFKVTIKSVQEIKPAELNDALAAKAGPFKTLTDLKADIKRQLQIERQNEAERTYQNSLVEAIASKIKVAIPEKLIDEEVDRGEKSERQNLLARGQTWQEHLDLEGVTEEQHRQRNRVSASDNLKASLVLSEIAEQQGIIVTPEELEVRLQLLRGQYTDKAMRSELDKSENQRDIENRLLTEKTLAKLQDLVS